MVIEEDRLMIIADEACLVGVGVLDLNLKEGAEKRGMKEWKIMLKRRSNFLCGESVRFGGKPWDRNEGT